MYTYIDYIFKSYAVDFPIEKLANFNLPCLPQATTALEKSSVQYYRGLPGFPHHDIHHITITNYPTCLRLQAPRKSQFFVLENPSNDPEREKSDLRRTNSKVSCTTFTLCPFKV